MSEPRARDVIAGVLGEHGLGWIDNGNPDLARCYCGHRPKLGESWYRHVADALIAAGVTMPAPPAIPDRVFIDDYGRRWEWFGGMEGTWAWRITALPATCGATTVIEGVEYVCQHGTHSTRGSHWTTRGTGAVHWWDDDEARL